MYGLKFLLKRRAKRHVCTVPGSLEKITLDPLKSLFRTACIELFCKDMINVASLENNKAKWAPNGWKSNIY